jgi:DNA-binding beta-propeller fold protein YncE
MNSRIRKSFSKVLALSLGLLLIYCSVNTLAISATPTATLKKIRTVDTDNLLNADFFKTPDSIFPGIAFPPGANTLLLVNQPDKQAGIVLLSPPKGNKDAVSRKSLPVDDPINIAFDTVSGDAKGYGLSRLFLLDADLDELVAIRSGARNVMDPANIKRLNVQRFGITDPQGMTINPETGQLLVLDGGHLPRIINIQPKPGREFADAKIEPVVISGLEGKLRGLAFNPADNHLYILSIDQQKLYKVTLEGELASSIDISNQETNTPQGMIFAPSLDLTDPPSIFHLYLATAHGANGEITEWAVP